VTYAPERNIFFYAHLNRIIAIREGRETRRDGRDNAIINRGRDVAPRERAGITAAAGGVLPTETRRRRACVPVGPRKLPARARAERRIIVVRIKKKSGVKIRFAR